MDECGIQAQVLFPNAVGLGGGNINNNVKDEKLRLLCIEIYNDAMAELQETSTSASSLPVMPTRTSTSAWGDVRSATHGAGAAST